MYFDDILLIKIEDDPIYDENYDANNHINLIYNECEEIKIKRRSRR